MSKDKDFKPTLAGYRDRCEKLERDIAVLKSAGPTTNEVTLWLIETAELFTKTAGMLIEMREDAPAAVTAAQSAAEQGGGA